MMYFVQLLAAASYNQLGISGKYCKHLFTMSRFLKAASILLCAFHFCSVPHFLSSFPSAVMMDSSKETVCWYGNWL